MFKIALPYLTDLTETERQEIQKQIEEKYNWDRIAEQTIEVYRKVLGQGA